MPLTFAKERWKKMKNLSERLEIRYANRQIRRRRGVAVKVCGGYVFIPSRDAMRGAQRP